MTQQSSHTFLGSAALIRMAHAEQDLTLLSTRLLAEIGDIPSVTHADAMLDLSTILQIKGEREVALSLQEESLRLKQLYHLAAPTGIPRIRLLALMAPGDLMTNTPLDFLLEGSDIALHILYVAPHLPFPDTLPEHDVMFVGIGESDETQALLQLLDVALQGWPRPIINHAEHITWLSRDRAYTRLSELPGVVMPATARATYASLHTMLQENSPLLHLLADIAYPLIIRPVGSHAGHGLERIDDAAALQDYLQRTVSDTYYISRFIDYRDADDQYRKYRVVLVEGKPYAAHMGISSHWMIHYLNAGMSESAEKRTEEERFMTSFDESFAVRHAEALAEIYQAMQLDYLVLDCAETKTGELLLFEVDNSAVVHTMDPLTLFPYKQPQMRKVFDAFRTMLVRAIVSPGD